METDRNVVTTSLETKLCATESAPLWRKRHSYSHVRNKDIVVCYRQRQLHCGDRDIVTITLETSLYATDRDSSAVETDRDKDPLWTQVPARGRDCFTLLLTGLFSNSGGQAQDVLGGLLYHSSPGDP